MLTILSKSHCSRKKERSYSVRGAKDTDTPKNIAIIYIIASNALHPTVQCNKSAETPVICVHCEGNHTTSYKGCPLYKELYNKGFLNPYLNL